MSARPGQAHLLAIERKRVGDAIVPWRNVVSIDLEQTASAVHEIALRSGHTRFPVTHGAGVTGVTGVTGVIHAKDLLPFLTQGGMDWRSLVRPIVRLDLRMWLTSPWPSLGIRPRAC